MYHAIIKLVYKYSDVRLMMQSLLPLELVRLGGRQGGTFIQTHHTTNIICTKQQSNMFTSILRKDSCCKACPPMMGWALEVDKDEHPYRYIILQI